MITATYAEIAAAERRAAVSAALRRLRRPDARPQRLVQLCSHEQHRHKGTRGAWCSWCGANWAALRPYECSIPACGWPSRLP
jgi:hypothetical protein